MTVRMNPDLPPHILREMAKEHDVKAGRCSGSWQRYHVSMADWLRESARNGGARAE